MALLSPSPSLLSLVAPLPLVPPNCHRYHHIACALYIHIGGHRGPRKQSWMKLDLDRHIEHMTIISKIVALVLPDQIESTAIVHVTNTLNMDIGNRDPHCFLFSIQHPQPYFLSHQIRQKARVYTVHQQNLDRDWIHLQSLVQFRRHETKGSVKPCTSAIHGRDHPPGRNDPDFQHNNQDHE